MPTAILGAGFIQNEVERGIFALFFRGHSEFELSPFGGTCTGHLVTFLQNIVSIFDRPGDGCFEDLCLSCDLELLLAHGRYSNVPEAFIGMRDHTIVG